MSKGLEVKVLITKDLCPLSLAGPTASALTIFCLLFLKGKVRCHKAGEVSVDFRLACRANSI
jgi:hypothetical protein